MIFQKFSLKRKLPCRKCITFPICKNKKIVECSLLNSYFNFEKYNCSDFDFIRYKIIAERVISEVFKWDFMKTHISIQKNKILVVSLGYVRKQYL